MPVGCSSWWDLASHELVSFYSRQIMILKMWKMAGVVLLWASFLVGKATPTVYREVVYEGGTSCTKQIYTTEFFGIPDDTGLRDFDTCLAGPDDVPRYYLQYTCVNSSVVAGMYVDSNCTDAVEEPGTIAVELTSELCTGNKTTSCSSTNPNTTASHNFSVSVETFTSPSCPANEVVDVLDEVDGFRHPQTNAVRECYPSETLDFNSKLVCADGELKTYYYDVSDHDCMLSPRAVISSPSCLEMGNASSNKVSCEASSDSPKLFAEETPPPLAGESSADAWYLHTKEYKNDTSGNCVVLVSETYFFEMPSEDGKFGNLGECYDAGSGTYMSMGCNEASGAVTANMYVSEGCPKNSFLQTIDGIFNGEPCSPWECTVIAPMYEATIDDWEVLIDYQVDGVCSSSTGKNEILSWAEAFDSGVFGDNSASNDEIAMVPSPSCSTSGNLRKTVRCVNGMLKVVLFGVDNINCTGSPHAVMHFPSCLQWEGDDEYIKLSCVEVFSQSDNNASSAHPSQSDNNASSAHSSQSDDDASSAHPSLSDDDASSAHPSKKQQWWLFETTTVTSLMIIFLVLGTINK